MQIITGIIVAFLVYEIAKGLAEWVNELNEKRKRRRRKKNDILQNKKQD